ncbi:MAG: GTP-binding protein [Anaerolineae bacterium]|nr:GTP-binding protein [Anaerolineae bacterium]
MISLSKKICLLGDFAVGKTSLVRRFVYNLFDDRYLSTIGVKVSRKVIMMPRADEIVELTLMVWDLAGSEEFSVVRSSYLRGAAGAIVVCDLTRSATLETVPTYLAELRRLNPAAALVLAANKADLNEKHEVSATQVEQQATALGIPCFITSARTGANVEAAFRCLGGQIIGGDSC